VDSGNKLDCYWKTRGIITIRLDHQNSIENKNTLDLPALLYGSGNWTVKAGDSRSITATEMKYM